GADHPAVSPDRRRQRCSSGGGIHESPYFSCYGLASTSRRLRLRSSLLGARVCSGRNPRERTLSGLRCHRCLSTHPRRPHTHLPRPRSWSGQSGYCVTAGIASSRNRSVLLITARENEFFRSLAIIHAHRSP